MPAAPIIVGIAVSSGVAATVGTAVVGTLVAGTVSTAVATAVGAGIISGGITAISGGKVSDVLKSAVVGGIAAGVGASIGGEVAASVSKAAAAAGEASIASTLGIAANTLGNIAGQTVGGGIQSAITAAAYGGDPVKALIKGGLTAGLTSSVMTAVNYGTSKIEGFNQLPDAVQRATKSALAAGALGKDPEKAALNSFLSSGSRYLGSQLKDYSKDVQTSYDTASARGKALEDNVARQNAIVDQYNSISTALNSDYDRVQTLSKEANDAIKAFEDGGKTQELADIANAKVKAANDFIAEYDKKYTDGKSTLDTLSAELNELKTKLPDQEKAFVDSKTALEDTTKLFNEQEAKNADLLANTVKNLEVASTTVKNDLGIDLSEDQIKQFVESGDVATAAQDYINTTNAASQELGFENYKDQTAALANEFTPEEAAQWNQYKDTSGVVGGIAPGVETTGLGGQTDVANVFEPSEFQTAESAYTEQTPEAQVAPEQALPADQQFALGEPFQYTADELYQDVAPEDFGFTTAQAAPEVPEVAPLQLDTTVAQAPAAPEESDQIQQLLDSFRQGTTPSEGVQTAAFTSPDIMSDVGGGDIGLRSLISQQKGGTSAQSDTLGLESIADRNLTSAPSDTDLTAVTPGSATYSALTGTDPTKTITGSVLGEDKGDVRGGVESSALYSGAEEEFAPSDLLSSKYLAEKPDEKKALEDVGVIGGDATKTASTTPSDTFVDPLSLTRATLPVSSEASQTKTALEGTNMDETDFTDALQLPPGAEPETPSGGAPDYGDGWIRNLSDNSQEFMTENGKVIYYDDGRVETYDNDGRYVMYGPDGRVIDYSNINDPNAKVQTFMPGANGVPTATYEGGKMFTGNKPGIGDRIAGAISQQFQKDPLKFLTALGGAAAGAASKRTGIQPRGLQSLTGLSGVAGGGAQRVQTGAVGTKGRGGVRFFERKAEGGAIDGYAGGGGLGYLKSAHDGMADKIDATIDNKRPAKLSGGEFVIPADVVSHLGNGNSEAGAKQLYDLMERVRKARTGTKEQGKQINPKKYLPK